MNDKVTALELMNEETSLTSITKGEVDMQVATANTYPRSIDKAIKNAITLATIDQETAESCMYALPRGKNPDGTPKFIKGESIRLAEIMLSSWRNMRCDARVIEEGRKEVTAQSTTWDMENNVLVRIEAKRRIVDSKGNRYKLDMILMTANAAISVALRNSIFRVIPRSLTKKVYKEAMRVAVGDAKTIVERRDIALETFKKLGVSSERVLSAVGRQGIDDITVEDLAILLGIRNAIRQGDTTIESAFPEKTEGKNNDDKKTKSRTEETLSRLQGDEQPQDEEHGDAWEGPEEEELTKSKKINVVDQTDEQGRKNGNYKNDRE